MTRKDRERALDAIYARIPKLSCKGRCADSCGPIGMTVLERERIARRGVAIPTHQEALRRVSAGVPGCLNCPALTAVGRCSVYGVRPLICRLWGVAEAMPCPHGCEPERWLNDKEARELLFDAMEVGGWPEGDMDVDAMREALKDPQLAVRVSGVARWGGRHG